MDVVGKTSSTFTTITLADEDIVTCVLTPDVPCQPSTPVGSNELEMTVTAVPSFGISVEIINSASMEERGRCRVTLVSPVSTATNYKWQIFRGGYWEDIPEATDFYYIMEDLVSGDYRCRCVVSFDCGDVISSPAALLFGIGVTKSPLMLKKWFYHFLCGDISLLPKSRRRCIEFVEMDATLLRGCLKSQKY